MERLWREATTRTRLDDLTTARPAVAQIFIAASRLLHALGERLSRLAVLARGPGAVRRDRVLATWVQFWPELTTPLRTPAGVPVARLRRLVRVVMHEGQHPNPSQPRREAEVHALLTRESEKLARAVA